MKTILLTGAGGFLGKHLMRLFLSAGIRVVAVTSCNQGELSKRCGLNLNASDVIILPTQERESIRIAMQDSDLLLNCGFPRGGNGFEMARGLDFIAWLFREASSQDLGAVINVSSQSIYDQHRTNSAVEGDFLCPEGDYAVAKLSTELMLESICANIPHTSIRLASLIGPGFGQRVVNKMVRKAIEGDVVVVQENESKFGYLDVRDAAEGFSLFLDTSPSTWESAYNLGPEDGYTLTEIGKCVLSVVQGLGVKSAGLEIQYSESRGVNTLVDSSRFKGITGWYAHYGLAESTRHIAIHELRVLNEGMNR